MTRTNMLLEAFTVLGLPAILSIVVVSLVGIGAVTPDPEGSLYMAMAVPMVMLLVVSAFAAGCQLGCFR